MGKPYTRIDIFGDFNGSGVQITGAALNKLRLESLKKAGSNWDDADVLLNFLNYPVIENEPPEGMDKMLWVINNIEGMKALRDGCFAKGVDPNIAKLTESQLCEIIKKNYGCDNEKAFELASKARSRKSVPATHIIWVSTADSPEYVKAFVLMHNKYAYENVNELMKNNPTMMCIDECKEDYSPSDYLCGDSVVRHMDSDGKVGLFA